MRKQCCQTPTQPQPRLKQSSKQDGLDMKLTLNTPTTTNHSPTQTQCQESLSCYRTDCHQTLKASFLGSTTQQEEHHQQQ